MCTLFTVVAKGQIEDGDTLRTIHGAGDRGEYKDVFLVNGTKRVKANWAIDRKEIIVKNVKQAPVGNGISVLGQIDSQLVFLRLPDAALSKEVDLPESYKKAVTSFTGETYRVGDTLLIGTGSMPDGDFKFIRTSATSFFQYYSDKGYQGLVNQANAFPRSYSGLKFKIIRIDKRGDRRHGYVFYPIIEINGLFRCEVDINNAIKAGEIITPGYDPTTNSKAIIVNQQSVADEIKKLKGLEDQGIITKEEFEKQKQKLLN